MTPGDRYGQAADDLSSVLDAMNDVDLNALPVDEDVRTFIEAKTELKEICLRCREDQQAARNS